MSARELESLIQAAPRDDAGRPQLVNLHLSRATIDADASFANVDFTGTASFDQAEFLGPATFDGATFTGTARFDGVRFRGPASFVGAAFAGTLWLNLAVADGSVTFEGGSMKRDATFDGTAFRGPAYFAGMSVDGDLSCDAARFAGAVTFEGAHLAGAASFARIVFADDVNFTGIRVEGRTSFEGSRIQGNLHGNGARFDLHPDLPASLERLRADRPVEVAPRATSDLPASDDLLGYAPIANALHALLDDPSTTLPLSVAITAPWGGGKSSVMRQLQARLNSPPAAYGASRRWTTIWFDAWRYERAERLWAALAKEIYSQAVAQMKRRESLVFRTRLEYRRLGPWKFLGKTLWPVLAALAAGVAVLAADLRDAGKVAAGLSAAAAAIGIATRYWEAMRDPFKRAIEHYASHPDYDQHLGFTSDAERDIKHLMSLLCDADTSAVAIFIDDLDRCSGGHVVEVVEAINQVFGASEEQRCAFVLGLDREVVATSIEVAYRDTVQALRDRGSALGESYGSNFLAKLVQVSVALPRPEHRTLRNLLDGLTGEAPPEAKPDPAAVQRLQATVAQEATSLASVDAVSDRLQASGESPSAVDEAARLTRARQLRDSEVVVAVERESVAFLERNPRQVKRFHNAFRLQLYIANEEQSISFSFTSDELHGLGRWVALRLRWPTLADAIDREPALLRAIEELANRLPEAAETAAIRRDASCAKWFSDADVLAVFEDALPGRRLTELRTDEFLSVA